MEGNSDILAFSHLRWNFVYQRPQHILSRLAAQRRVLVIEEPVFSDDDAPRWERQQAAPGVLVCRLHTPCPAPGFHDAHLSVSVPMLSWLLGDLGVADYTAWLYTPMALPLARSVVPQPQAVVYDCMDELSAFANAPREMLDREAALLGWADCVFTGGPSLYRAKRDRHPNVRCFPSSVDAAHFRQALGGLTEPADQAGLPGPRLGFYGVLDERLDRELLAALAQAHPEWQIVMVGPVVKISHDDLPRAANIHYLGQRDYADLPAYLAGWDVCLLPFARNEATRFISPTKTLEYMAAERPIVSTPIADVAEPYGEIVYLGDTAERFVAACERALAASPEERARRAAGMRAVLDRTSWDRTVAAMGHALDALPLSALELGSVRPAPSRRLAAAVRPFAKG